MPDKKNHQLPTGTNLLHNPRLNKGTAFTEEERRAFGLSGLIPPCVCTIEQQVERVRGHLGLKPNDLARYIYLIALQDRNETLFYRVLLDSIEEFMPIIYTPTVGLACQEYGHIFRRSHGLYLSIEERGRVAEILGNWPESEVRVIVVTDGERILGLGDLGANGMGIPVGKLSLYTACAGIHPAHCLPITIDVGTENEALLEDPLYLGLRQRRVRGEAYDAFIEEFIQAASAKFPGVLIQFEDFGNANAFRLLEEYQNRVCTFNDDIQGTGAVALAGLYSATKIIGARLRDQRILFFGAGEAGIGIGTLVVAALQDEGLSEQEARSRCAFCDSRGLITRTRTDLSAHKQAFAIEHEPASSFEDALATWMPTAIIGASGKPNSFTRPVIEKMASLNQRPIIFPLSNPTSKAECTAEEAYIWSGGRAIFASGSPFEPVTVKGKKLVPGQGNNAYVFPGVGLGVLACGARRVTAEMFLSAARALAATVGETDLGQGRVFPPLERIREVSAGIALEVAREAYRSGIAALPPPNDLAACIVSQVYEPVYQKYV